MRTYALTRGLWQPTQRDATASFRIEDPALAKLYPAFDEEIREALSEYWRGALIA